MIWWVIHINELEQIKLNFDFNLIIEHVLQPNVHVFTEVN